MMVLVRKRRPGEPRPKHYEPPLPTKPWVPYDSVAWDEGVVAYQAGIPFEQCPYRKGSHKQDSWEDGHIVAEFDANEPHPSTVDDNPNIPF